MRSAPRPAFDCRKRGGDARREQGYDTTVPRWDITGLRLRNERLTGGPLEKPEDVVSWLGAVQAQDYAGAKWALGLRARSCTDDDIERALDRGAILRTHVLRPTWHFVAPADVRWMLELTAPRVNAASAYYAKKRGLDDRTFGRSNA